MKHYSEIQELLDRYWEGETTLEEERRLKAFFNAGNVPAQFQREAQLFQAFQAEKSVQLSTTKQIPYQRTRIRWYGLAAAAIAFLLIAGTWWFVKQAGPEPKQQVQAPTQPIISPPVEKPPTVEIETAKETLPTKLAQTQIPKIKRKPRKSHPVVAEDQIVQQEDSFDDPEKALEEIKAVLALVSSKINKSKRTLDKGLQEVENVDILVKKKTAG